MQSLGVLPGSPPKVLRKSKAAKAAPLKRVLSSITNERLSVPAPTHSSSITPRERGSVPAAIPPSTDPSCDPQEIVSAPIASRERPEIVMDNNPRERNSQKTPKIPITRGPTKERGSGQAPTHSSTISSRDRQVFLQDEMDIDSHEQTGQKTPIPSRSKIEVGSGRAPPHPGDLAEFDSRGRTKERSAIPHRASNSTSSSSSCSRSETRKHMKSAPFVDGAIPSGRPAIKDYIPVVRRRLLDGAYIYENWVLSNNSFPDKELQYTWAREAWDRASEDALDLYKLSDRMMKLVSGSVFF